MRSVVMGIDPGLARTGYGVVESQSGRLGLLEAGVVHTSRTATLSNRLAVLYGAIDALIEHYRPQALAVERIFFSSNTSSAIAVAQAGAVAIVAAGCRDIEVCEYTPAQVKSGVCGHGSATKQQVQYMVAKLLKVNEPAWQPDAADALALAIGNLHGRGAEQLLKQARAQAQLGTPASPYRAS